MTAAPAKAATANSASRAASRTSISRNGYTAHHPEEEKCRSATEKCRCRLAPIPNGLRRNSTYKHVTYDSAAQGSGKSQDHEAKEIKIATGSGSRAFHGEQECYCEIGCEKQSFGFVLHHSAIFTCRCGQNMNFSAN